MGNTKSQMTKLKNGEEGKEDKNSEKALRNALREVRTRLGKSQQELAQAAGIARQTIGGIEAGTYSVSMAVALKIARVLGCRVEELFWLEEPRTLLTPTLAQGSDTTGAVQLAKIEGRWVAHSLTGYKAFRQEMVPADGIFKNIGPVNSGQIEILDDEEALAGTILLAGCAPALSLWARSAECWHPGLRIRWVHANSEQALAMLARGEVHAAGLHFPTDNLLKVRDHLKGDVTLVELGVWEEGLAIRGGNPKQVKSLSDLASSSVTIVNRELGAGCRHLLDNQLVAVGVSPYTLKGYENTVPGHVEVAQAVACGEADAGVTVSGVARAYGLDFLPLQSVRYELAMRPNTFSLPTMQRFLETLHHRWVRTQLQEIGGYSVANTGRVRQGPDPDYDKIRARL